MKASRTIRLTLGDSFEVMATYPENSIGAVISDPPYGIGFMGKQWDAIHEMQRWHETWLTEAYRILIPGGIIKAFSATRTYHRLAMAMHEVGFENIHGEAWCYGSGFPKSLNVGKALEKAGELELAKQFEGYGTALKPAYEIFICARKPGRE